MNDSLRAYTERAMQATYTGELIPPIVYVPAKLRRGKQRLNFKGHVTTNAKTPDEIEAQIAAADPTGLLIALMQGQPVPTFTLHPAPTDADPDRVEIATVFEIAPLELRAEIAFKLSARQRQTKKATDIAFAARVAQAAEAHDEETDD